jgi:hypothetical protein
MRHGCVLTGWYLPQFQQRFVVFSVQAFYILSLFVFFDAVASGIVFLVEETKHLEIQLSFQC